MAGQSSSAVERAARGAPRSKGAGTRAILAASAGNLLEWYDFAVYAQFAIYIGANFSRTATAVPMW